MLFIQQPRLVEAVQWNGETTFEDFPEWFIQAIKDGEISVTKGVENEARLEVKTSASVLVAVYKTAWIIIVPDSLDVQFQVYADDKFRLLYSPAIDLLDMKL